jgi:ATP-dependent RNA helicase DeaD
VYLVTGADKLRTLVRVIAREAPDSAIVFCNTKDETQAVARYLVDAGYNAEWINSDLSQAERERVMTATRGKALRFLVATDVAARGIDISHLSHVINYSFPESLEVYIHRTGRTGRQGRAGMAISLIAPQNVGDLYFLRLTYKIFPVEKTLPDKETEERALELDRLQSLRDQLSGRTDPGFFNLARRLYQSVEGERIVAALLERHFADRPTKLAPSATAPAISTAPLPETIDADGECAADDEGDEQQAPSGAREIFIDAGRKDGLRISSLMKDLVALSGLPRTAIGRVRMLTRATFIAAPDDSYDHVFDALAKVEVGGRRLRVEPAKEP